MHECLRKAQNAELPFVGGVKKVAEFEKEKEKNTQK